MKRMKNNKRTEMMMVSPNPRQNVRTPTSRNSPTLLQDISSPGKGFYAGAKFETEPRTCAIPTPPLHWTTKVLHRSHSQPSSPTFLPPSTPTQQKTVAIDLAKLFGSPSPKPAMANSFLSEIRIQDLLMSKDKKKDLLPIIPTSDGESACDEESMDARSIVSDIESAYVTGSSDGESTDDSDVSTSEVSRKAIDLKQKLSGTDELKRALGLFQLSSECEWNKTCRGSLSPSSMNNYKEMSNRLKSLMKVVA